MNTMLGCAGSNNLKPFDSQEWSMSNFSCGLTRNITSHSIKNFIAYSVETSSYHQFSLPHLSISLWKVKWIYFLNLGVKGIKNPRPRWLCHRFYDYWASNILSMAAVDLPLIVVSLVNSSPQFLSPQYVGFAFIDPLDLMRGDSSNPVIPMECGIQNAIVANYPFHPN